MISEGSCDIED